MTFQVEWTSEAWTEVRALTARDRRSLMESVGALAGRAEVATGGRRPLDGRLGEPPDPIWAARLRGGHRLLYAVTGPARDGGRRCVWVLRAIIGSPSGRLVLTARETRELERRRRTLCKLAGGIPHEVVRRAWLAELARDPT
jgi:mRNA-degrading endonuclease RelE of RelBE toxin-antitoxin system